MKLTIVRIETRQKWLQHRLGTLGSGCKQPHEGTELPPNFVLAEPLLCLESCTAESKATAFPIRQFPCCRFPGRAHLKGANGGVTTTYRKPQWPSYQGVLLMWLGLAFSLQGTEGSLCCFCDLWEYPLWRERETGMEEAYWLQWHQPDTNFALAPVDHMSVSPRVLFYHALLSHTPHFPMEDALM